MSLGQLVLELKLNGNEFTVGLKRAEGQLGRFVLGTNQASNAIQRAQRSTSSWGHSIRDVIIGLALARDAVRTVAAVTFGWQKAIVSVNSDMERSIALMKNFSKQSDPMAATAEAVGDVNKLLDRASTSPFSLTAITDTFVKLRVGGVEPVDRALGTLVDSVAAFGGSGENLKRAGVAIQQMSGKGVVSMEELRQQLGESVPTAINAMADALGTSYSKLVKEISQGKVTSKPAIAAMMQELEVSFKGSAAAMMNTWGGAVAQFETGAKKLAVAFGGLNDNGYEEGGYLKTITNELKGLSQTLTSPEIIDSAREIGKAVAEMITSVANGTKWVIEHRNEIYEWGKALIYLWAAFKGASIISRVLGSAGTSIGALAMQMINLKMTTGSMTTGFRATAVAMSGWNSSAAIAAGGAVRIATGSSAAGGAIRILGGALGVVAGPIGMVTGLAIAGGYAWYEHAKGVRDARDAVLALNGALTNNAQLLILKEARDSKRKDYKEKFESGPPSTLGQYSEFKSQKDYWEKKAAAEADMKKTDDDFLKARMTVATLNARSQADHEMQVSDAMVGELSRKYGINKEILRKQMEDEAKKSNRKFDTQEFRSSLNQIVGLKIQEEIDTYQTAKSEAEKAIEALKKNSPKSSDGKPIMSQDELVALEKAKMLVGDYTIKIGEAKDQLSEIGKYDLAGTIVGAENADGLKPKFDGLKIFVDGMRKKLSTLDAKVDETNPYLAQLEATVESLGGKKLDNFDAMMADGTRIAEAVWAQEKAKKALTEADKVYADSLERIHQIESLASAKINKTEELNPWLKASADAIRYEDELKDLILKMDEAKAAAYAAQAGGVGKSQLEKIEQDAVKAAAAVDQAQAALDRLKVSDAIKGMSEDSITISEGLMTNSEAIKAEYERRSAWADDFYAKNKANILAGSADEAAYNEYRKQLQAKYQRDTESGLDAWIRQNKDATEAYKSLWGSAMDRFNDTLVTGLMKGKFELGSFVEYVLEEILRIQMAKQLAAAADAIIGGGGGSGWMGMVTGAIGSYFGGPTGGAAAGAASGAASGAGGSFGQLGGSYQSSVFADGVMTEYGQLALKKYSNGGVARTPQVAIYGEGTGAEAYVPLPDGRTIPVTMSGGQPSGGGMSAGPVPVEVNVYNQSGEQQSATSNSSFDGEKMVVDIILKKLSQPGPVRDAVRSA